VKDMLIVVNTKNATTDWDVATVVDKMILSEDLWCPPSGFLSIISMAQSCNVCSCPVMIYPL
jgi:hypothetical protein